MNNLQELNDLQREAVMHKDGPCLVIAGAGSGKTKVLTTRIATLIDSGVESYHILAITFTNKAAKEMKERLNKIVEDNQAFVGTFHSFGMRVIRENVLKLGMTRNFTILDSEAASSFAKQTTATILFSYFSSVLRSCLIVESKSEAETKRSS